MLSIVCDVESVLFDGRLVTEEDSVDGTLVVVFAAVEDPVISVISVIVEDSVVS